MADHLPELDVLLYVIVSTKVQILDAVAGVTQGEWSLVLKVIGLILM